MVIAVYWRGSTLEQVTSSVWKSHLYKSGLLVPCMWNSETRLHSQEQDSFFTLIFHSEGIRACMTSPTVGLQLPVFIGSTLEKRAFRWRLVLLNWPMVEENSFLGYKFCQPNTCWVGDHKVGYRYHKPFISQCQSFFM